MAILGIHVKFQGCSLDDSIWFQDVIWVFISAITIGSYCETWSAWEGLQILNHHAVQICSVQIYIYIIYIYISIYMHLYLACKALGISLAWKWIPTKHTLNTGTVNSFKKKLFSPECSGNNATFLEAINCSICRFLRQQPPQKKNTTPLSLTTLNPVQDPTSYSNQKPHLAGSYGKYMSKSCTVNYRPFNFHKTCTCSSKFTLISAISELSHVSPGAWRKTQLLVATAKYGTKTSLVVSTHVNKY